MMYLGNNPVALNIDCTNIDADFKILKFTAPSTTTLADEFKTLILNNFHSNVYVFGINATACDPAGLYNQHVYTFKVKIIDNDLTGFYTRKNNSSVSVHETWTDTYGARVEKGNEFICLYKEVTPNA